MELASCQPPDAWRWLLDFGGNLYTPELVLSKSEVTASQTLLPEFGTLK